MQEKGGDVGAGKGDEWVGGLGAGRGGREREVGLMERDREIECREMD